MSRFGPGCLLLLLLLLPFVVYADSLPWLACVQAGGTCVPVACVARLDPAHMVQLPPKVTMNSDMLGMEVNCDMTEFCRMDPTTPCPPIPDFALPGYVWCSTRTACDPRPARPDDTYTV